MQFTPNLNKNARFLCENDVTITIRDENGNKDESNIRLDEHNWR